MRVFILGLLLAFTAFVSSGVVDAADPERSDEIVKLLEHELEVIHSIEDKIERELGVMAQNTLHDDHGAKAGLPQLNPKWYISQFFWLAVMFVIMYMAFRFKVLPDLSNVIERRREQIDGDLTAAEHLKEEAERVHAEYDAILAQAREKSSALFRRVEDKIKDKEQEEYSVFQNKASDKIADAEKDIAKATAVAIKDMNILVVEIATIAADRLVGVTTDKKNAKSIVAGLENKKAA